MKRLFIILLILCACFGGYKIIRIQLSTNLALNARIAGITDKLSKVTSDSAEALNNLKKNSRLSIREAKKAIQRDAAEEKADKGIRVYLKHGGVIEGKLLSKTDKEYTVEWKGEPSVIMAAQIDHVEYKTQRDIEWTYKNDVVIKRNNGIVLDGEIIEVGTDTVTMLFEEGGGRLEMGVNRSDIDHLMFAPVCNKESQDIEARLKTQFPKMKFYKEGDVTIVTDSYITWVNAYKKALREEYTQIYLKFFNLFKGRKAQNQNFVVIFDDIYDFDEYALSDGVPFWLVLGYFNPADKVLHLYNAFGDRMEKIVFEVMVGRSGKTIDQIVGIIKKHVDERYHEFIEGKVKEITDRYWDAYSLYKNELTERTFSTLRHEFTHEVFHNWGLQNIILSKPNVDKKKMADKKREFLETKDWKKKEELLMVLMKLRKEEDEDLSIEASESWLAEGLATYCETDPLGSVNEQWLFIFQEMIRKNEMNPIEFLTDFRMGSFPGLCSRAQINSYAESWAFTSFLMNKYPGQFIDYQKARADNKTEKGKEDLALLLKSLGRDLPVLEGEFREYMNAYQKAEDPDVKRFMRYHKIWSDLMNS